MTDHPCKGMSASQIHMFEQLSIGRKPIGTRGAFDALEKRGVIERSADLINRDALGEFRVPQWKVPLPIHMQWCQWCSEQEETP